MGASARRRACAGGSAGGPSPARGARDSQSRTPNQPAPATLDGHRLGGCGGAVGLAGALADLPVALVIFLQAIREEAREAGLDPDRDGVALASLEILSSGRVLAVAEVLNPAYVSGRLALAGPTLSGWIARTVPRLIPLLGPRLAASAVPLVGALGGAVLNAAWLEHYRSLARIRFRLMALAEHHGAEAVVRAYARAQALPAVD